MKLFPRSKPAADTSSAAQNTARTSLIGIGPEFFRRRGELIDRIGEIEGRLATLKSEADKLFDGAGESPIAGLADDLLSIEDERRTLAAVRDAVKAKIAEHDVVFEKAADRLSDTVRAAQHDCVEIVRAKMRESLAPIFGPTGNLGLAEREAFNGQLDVIVEKSAAVRREAALETFVFFLRDVGNDPLKYIPLVEVYQAGIASLKRRAEILRKLPMDKLDSADLPEPAMATFHKQHAGKKRIPNYEEPMTPEREQAEYDRRVAAYAEAKKTLKGMDLTPEERGILNPDVWRERQRQHDLEMHALAAAN